MATIPSSSTNKKKRKVTELIDYWSTSKAPLPPPLVLGEDGMIIENLPTTEPSVHDTQRPIKKKKSSENLDFSEHVLDNSNSKRAVPERMNSKPKLSSGNLSEKRLRERRRTEAANEILSSERNYVTTLESFMTNFACPLSASKSNLINESDRNLLCNDIDMILQLNKAFLTQIAERMRLFTSKTPIADIFLSFLPHFKMYTAYCCKYSQISEMVIKLRSENKSFKSFLKKAEAHSKHPIADFLIAPVQRIPRLALLIDSLLKFTDPVHPDYDHLKQALEESKEAARLINSKMHEVEVRQKVVSIHRRFDPMIEDFLDGPLVQPHRFFLHEGVLARKSGLQHTIGDDDDWSDSEESESEKQEDCEKGKFYCFLFNDLFLVGTSVGTGKSKRLVYETSFELSTTFVRDDMNGLCFQLVNPRCTYVWLAPSASEKDEWKKQIEEAVENLLKQHPTLNTQRNRVNLTLDEDTNEWQAEIRAPSKCVRIDPVSYREEVLQNTQKHLTQFMHEHHEKLAKHKAITTVSSPGKNKSVFQRVKDSFTPKKRQSLKMTATSNDENSRSENAVGSPAANSHYSLGYNAGGVIGIKSNSSDSFSSPASRKSEKLSEIVEELDGISCLNRQLEYLNQELQEVRQIRRMARQEPGLKRTMTSPTRNPISRCESLAPMRENAAQPKLKSSISSGRLAFNSPTTKGSASPNTRVAADAENVVNASLGSDDKISKKRSKSIKIDQSKRATLVTTSAPSLHKKNSQILTFATERRSTLVQESTPASPIKMVPRAKDTDTILTKKSSIRRSRMSLGGNEISHSKMIISTAALPKPLEL